MRIFLYGFEKKLEQLHLPLLSIALQKASIPKTPPVKKEKTPRKARSELVAVRRSLRFKEGSAAPVYREIVFHDRIHLPRRKSTSRGRKERSNVCVGFVTNTAHCLTPRTLSHDKGKECLQSFGTHTLSFQFGVGVMECGTSVDAERGITPQTEYYTPVIELYDKPDDGTDHSLKHSETLKCETFEKDTNMALTFVTQRLFKPDVNDCLPIKNA